MRFLHQTVLISLILIACGVQADIRFLEMAKQQGILGTGTSYGASWGDVNGDGFPDIWAGNHDLPPTLYLNRGDGTFSTYLLPTGLQPNADLHGAAWADFDADGNQDLYIAVDALYQNNLLVESMGSDALLINNKGALRLSSTDESSLSGRASRQALWLDADLDGDLDVFVVGRKTSSSKHPNNLLLLQNQAGHFERSKLNFETQRTSRSDRYLGLIENLFTGQFKIPVDTSVTPHQESAQLVDLDNDAKSELWVLNSPSRVYELGEMEDVTFNRGLPEAKDLVDISVVDIDQDGFNDIVALQGGYRASDVVRVNPYLLEATILGHSKAISKNDAKGLDIVTDGDLTVEVGPTWFPLTHLSVSGNPTPTNRKFTLTKEDTTALSKNAMSDNKLSVGRSNDRWQIRHAVDWEHVDLKISSTRPIVEFEPISFAPHTSKGSLVIYYGSEDGFQPAAKIAQNVSCFSLITEDFDNDSDLDIYAVCTGPIRNHANLLLENIEPRVFSLIHGAGGAEGSSIGRGDVVASADYDRDGDIDLFVTNGADPTSFFVEFGPHELFVNQNNTGNWLSIELIGEGKNRHAYGAVIEVILEDKVLRRTAAGGMHRFTQNSQILHFGLADRTLIERIRVHWPAGNKTELTDISINQFIQIRE